jgi:hypothetical protein
MVGFVGEVVPFGRDERPAFEVGFEMEMGRRSLGRDMAARKDGRGGEDTRLATLAEGAGSWGGRRNEETYRRTWDDSLAA